MSEECDDTITPEELEIESVGITENADALANEARYDDIDQGKMEPDGNDEKNTDRSADRMPDTGNEEGEHLRRNTDISEGMTGKTLVSEETRTAEVQLRKNPTAVIVGQNHKFTVRSRYLSASTGSCHDFCKYGHKHEIKSKTKRPSVGTITEARPLRNTASSNIRVKSVKSVPEKEPRNKALTRRLSLPGPIPEKEPPGPMPEKEPLNHHKDNHAESVTRNPLKLKRIQSDIKPPSVPTPGNSRSRSKIDIPAVKKTPVQSSDSLEKSSQKVKVIKAKKEAGSYSKGEKEKRKETMSNSPKTLLKKSPSIKARLYKNLRSISRSRFQSDSEEAKISSSDDVPKKTVHTIEPNGNNTPAKKAPKISIFSEKSPNTPWLSRARKSNGSKGDSKGSRFGLSLASLTSASTSAASRAQGPSLPQGENQKKLDSMKTKKIDTKEEDGSKTNTPRAKTTLESKTKVKRTGVSRPEEKDGSVWKVKFRRGTVLNLQVASNSPRKLRFKRGRILGDDQNDKAEKSLKKKDDFADESPDSQPEPGKVRLRRQEASAKKDSVDLNNVIEETASKLVKTRKSKVKALVGAFETVMSFRDRKPLVEASAS